MAEQDEILVVSPSDRKPGPSTPGMDRQQAVAGSGTLGMLRLTSRTVASLVELATGLWLFVALVVVAVAHRRLVRVRRPRPRRWALPSSASSLAARSEERRVGKEC